MLDPVIEPGATFKDPAPVRPPVADPDPAWFWPLFAFAVAAGLIASWLWPYWMPAQ